MLPWGSQVTFKWIFLLNIFCLKPWLSAANTKQSTMPLPCPPYKAPVKVIPMREALLPFLAGSAGSHDPGRAPCQVWAHTAM